MRSICTGGKYIDMELGYVTIETRPQILTVCVTLALLTDVFVDAFAVSITLAI